MTDADSIPSVESRRPAGPESLGTALGREQVLDRLAALLRQAPDPDPVHECPVTAKQQAAILGGRVPLAPPCSACRCYLPERKVCCRRNHVQVGIEPDERACNGKWFEAKEGTR